MVSHPSFSWRSKLHSDMTMYDGMFIAGMYLPEGDITYYLPMSLWSVLDRSNIATLDTAPEFDGHTSNDVLYRLSAFKQYLIGE